MEQLASRIPGFPADGVGTTDGGCVLPHEFEKTLERIRGNGRKPFSEPQVTSAPGRTGSKRCFNTDLQNIHWEKKGKNHADRGTSNPPAGRETASLFAAFHRPTPAKQRTSVPEARLACCFRKSKLKKFETKNDISKTKEN